MANGKSIFESALDRSTPGFDSLLNVIQTETNRIERNRQLAQQQEMEQDLLDLQAETEIEVYNETVAKQKKKDRQLSRDLAAAEEVVDAATDTRKANEEVEELKDETRQELEDTFVERFQPMKDMGFKNIPVPEYVAKGDTVGGINGYYRIKSKGIVEDLTPKEFEERYGWTQEASNYIKEYNKLLEDDRITVASSSSEVEPSSMTTALGNAVSEEVLGIGTGEVKEKVVKKNLGSEEASEIIAKLRAGDKEVLRKFKSGQYDFNRMPKGEGDIRRSIQSNMSALSDRLSQEADKFPNMPIGLPFFDIGSGQAIGTFNVNRIAQELADEGGTEGGKSVTAMWNSIVDQYKRLKKGKKTSFSDLYLNPKIVTGNFTDVPVENYFITEDEMLDTSMLEEGIQGNDFEVTEKNIRNRKSQIFLEQAVSDTTNN